MRKILAISGGIDSVALLHMMRSDSSVLVAHFNHGIRENSDEDELFVKNLAKKYKLDFESKKELLGKDCSEAEAREKRYCFLNYLCDKYEGEIYTAHHKDDLIESIVINIVRGTGWRGLVPLDDPKIKRPLLDMSKKDIYIYAFENNLTFRHDSTNTSDAYLRNRIRGMATQVNSQEKEQLLSLYLKQKKLKDEADSVLFDILPSNNIYPREWFKDIDDQAGMEILRAALKKVGRSATRPQLKNFLIAVQKYNTNKRFNLGNNYLVTIKKENFQLVGEQ